MPASKKIGFLAERFCVASLMELNVRGTRIVVGEGVVTAGGRTWCGDTQECLQKAIDHCLDSRILNVKDYRYRGSIHSAWARMVKHRDSYRCRECGAGDVEAHHILPVSKGGGYEMDNGIALCVSCHKKKH